MTNWQLVIYRLSCVAKDVYAEFTLFVNTALVGTWVNTNEMYRKIYSGLRWLYGEGTKSRT
jgi:hypothetical protein